MSKSAEITPLINIEDNIYAKLECKNPAGSTKDRVAAQIICDAENQGKIKPGATIVEATSGNTGIGLAQVARSKNYRCKIFMPQNMSKERIALMESYGAEVILTDADLGMQGSVDAAKDFCSKNANCFFADQFNNDSNWKAHYNTTGPEIYSQTEKDIDVFVAGIGTGGTITGVGKYLREKNPAIKIIGVLPKTNPHAIQGIGAGFTPSILDTNIYDEILEISDDEAIKGFRDLNQKFDGMFGISSGAAYAAAKTYQKKYGNDARIVILCADGKDRYE